MVWPIGIGLLSGFYISKFAAGEKEGEKPHLKLKIKKYRLHVHHWMHQSALLVTVSVLQIKETMTLPPWLFHGIMGTSIGSIIHGLGYKDWKRVIWKETTD